jgi:hypothetical protein
MPQHFARVPLNGHKSGTCHLPVYDLCRAACPEFGMLNRQMAMSVMRHNDRRLTDKVYTDENLLGTWGAIDSLPHYANQASQLASQNLGAGGQNVSPHVETGDGEKAKETLANIGASHDLAQCDAMGRLAGNGGSGGARTRNLCRDRAAL